MKTKKVQNCPYQSCDIEGDHRHYSGNGCVVVIGDDEDFNERD